MNEDEVITEFKRRKKRLLLCFIGPITTYLFYALLKHTSCLQGSEFLKELSLAIFMLSCGIIVWYARKTYRCPACSATLETFGRNLDMNPSNCNDCGAKLK